MDSKGFLVDEFGNRITSSAERPASPKRLAPPKRPEWEKALDQALSASQEDAEFTAHMRFGGLADRPSGRFGGMGSFRPGCALRLDQSGY